MVFGENHFNYFCRSVQKSDEPKKKKKKTIDQLNRYITTD